jgi:glycosyltransferase involved in cell wall biosynthesis
MSKKLTIGMAVYDDYDGVFFSVQALRLYQLNDIENEVEIVVIDNNPESPQGKATKNFISNYVHGKYVPFIGKKSTSVRNEIFKHATGEYVVCMDSHVMFIPGAIKALMQYYEQNPETKNFIQGPLIYDDLKNISTHFDPVWRDNMFGIWATDNKYKKEEPFEIPMMGLGMFSCRKAAWPGFNERFKGFGGEEGYIHEKIRRAGGVCLCMPKLAWNHRFERPNGVPYPNLIEDRVWNYFVGWMEILKDPNHVFIQSIFKAFENTLPRPVLNDIFNKARGIK